MIIPKKGKFILHIKSQEQWNACLEQLSYRLSGKKDYLRNNYGTTSKGKVNDSMDVVDGEYIGYCDLQWFRDYPKYNNHIFIEVEVSGYSHLLGSPNYEELDNVKPIEYVQI